MKTKQKNTLPPRQPTLHPGREKKNRNQHSSRQWSRKNTRLPQRVQASGGACHARLRNPLCGVHTTMKTSRSARNVTSRSANVGVASGWPMRNFPKPSRKMLTRCTHRQSCGSRRRNGGRLFWTSMVRLRRHCKEHIKACVFFV